MSWLRRRSRRRWQWLRMRRKIQCHNKFEPADTQEHSQVLQTHAPFALVPATDTPRETRSSLSLSSP